MRKPLYDFCLKNGRESLLTQWDQKNTPSLPTMLPTAASKKSGGAVNRDMNGRRQFIPGRGKRPIVLSAPGHTLRLSGLQERHRDESKKFHGGRV